MFVHFHRGQRRMPVFHSIALFVLFLGGRLLTDTGVKLMNSKPTDGPVPTPTVLGFRHKHRHVYLFT